MPLHTRWFPCTEGPGERLLKHRAKGNPITARDASAASRSCRNTFLNLECCLVVGNGYSMARISVCQRVACSCPASPVDDSASPAWCAANRDVLLRFASRRKFASKLFRVSIQGSNRSEAPARATACCYDARSAHNFCLFLEIAWKRWQGGRSKAE